MSLAPESTPPESSSPPRPSRGSWWKRALVAVVLVVVVIVGAAIGVLGHLGHPWVKPFVTRTVRSSLGLDVDYRSLSIDPFRGHVSASGLTIAQPSRFRWTERYFVTLESLTADANVRALLSGEARLPRVELQGLAVTYVADEQTDTVSLLFPSDPKEPVTPLSHSLDALHDLGVDVGALRAAGVHLRHVALERRAVVSRLDAESLALMGHVHALRGVPDLRLHLTPEGSSGATVSLEQAGRSASADGRTPAKAATHVRARLAIDASLGVKQAARLALTARVLEQSGLRVPAGAVLATTADVEVSFDPRAARTHLAIRRLSVADALLVATFAANVEDRATDTLRDATGEAHVAFDELPFPIEGLEAERVRARASFENAVLSPSRVAGRVDAQASAGRLGIVAGGRRGGGAELALTLASDASAALGTDRSGVSAAGAAPQFDSLRAEVRGRTFFAEDAGENEGSHSTVRGEGLHATVSGAGGDAVDVSIAELELARGRTTSANATTLVLHAEGPGLATALANAAPATGTATLSAARLSARDGRDSVDVAPVDVWLDLHSFLASGGGLFGLGGVVDARVRTAGTARSGAQRARFAGLGPSAHVDLDRGVIDGTLPVAGLTVQEGAVTTLAVRGADLRFSSEHATTLAPPEANGRVKLEGSVDHLASGTNELSLPTLSLEVRGDRHAYVLAGGATVAELGTSGTRFPGTHPIRVEGRVDPRTQTADLELHLGVGGAPASPRADATLHAAIDPSTGALTDRFSSDAANVEPFLGPFLPAGVQAHVGRAHVEGDGRLMGMFLRRTRTGATPVVAPDAATSVHGDQRIAVVLEDVDVRNGDARLESGRLELAAQFRRDRAAESIVEVRADAATLALARGTHRVTAIDVHPVVTARIPDLAVPMKASVSTDVRIARLDQRFVPEYPVSDVRLTAVLDTAPTGAILRDFVLVNGGSLASLRMTGAYERELGDVARVGDEAVAMHGREAISLQGDFDHDIAPLSGTTFARSASGHLNVPFTLESGDLSSFRVRARLIATNVDFVNAEGSLSVSKLDGEIPVEEVFVLLESGVVIDPGADTNPLARMRFPDVQPFLDRDSFVTVDRIAWKEEVFGPLAANAGVSGTVVGMDRLEVGFRGGRVTGQLVADLRPGAASIALRADATGIHSHRSPNEVLDANLALRFQPESLALDGTAQLVRLGRSHLFDILDVFDVFHEDVELNRIRSALQIGYPRFVRIRAADGLMDIEVKLGGLARVLKIETVHAIPMAPLLEERVAPYVDPMFNRDASEAAARVAGQEEAEGAP